MLPWELAINFSEHLALISVLTSSYKQTTIEISALTGFEYHCVLSHSAGSDPSQPHGL